MTIKFHGIESYGDPLFSDLLETSVHMFLQNGFLCTGAFTNVLVPTGQFVAGEGFHSLPSYKLRLTRDPRYVAGSVWESARADWVWESGIDYSYQPIQISGIYLNDNFIPKETVGPTGFKINYPEGKIVFNSAIPTNSVVKCEYSYRNVRLATADSHWFQTVQFDSFRVDDNQFLTKGSGMWDILSLNRIQLPAVVLETLPSVVMKGYELGAINRVHKQDMFMHVLAEIPWDRKQIHDIILNQWEKRFWGVDKKKLLADKKYPLLFDGQLSPSGISYEQITTDYQWKLISFDKIRSQEQMSAPPMYRSSIRVTFSIDSL
jgi:hypothetical protein